MDKKKQTKKKINKDINIKEFPINIDQSIKQVGQRDLIEKKSKLTIAYWKQSLIKKKFRFALVVNMQFSNGSHSTFYVKTNNNSFTFENKTYIIDEDALYYNIAYKEYCLDYHESLSIPVKRNIPVHKFYKEIKDLDDNIEMASDPSLIEKFIAARVIEGIMKGQDIDDFLRQLRLIVIIGALAGILSLLILIKGSGMLDNLNLPI